jgi:hypothetical protein
MAKGETLSEEAEMIGLAKTTIVVMALAAVAAPSPVAAHCDSLDGPVVKAARQALAAGDVARVLVWVRVQDEPEIRAAFARTVDVRKLGGQARELADLWFFETLVRVHRAGEGEPYTGLKPAGYQPPKGIVAADRALEDGSIQTLAQQVAGEVSISLIERYDRVRALAGYAPGDVEAGRRYVHVYVEFIHYVETLHELLHEDAAAHAVAAAATER